MHHRDNPYLIKQFTAGMKTQLLNTDTLAVSKDALPSPTEIRVLAAARRDELSVNRFYFERFCWSGTALGFCLTTFVRAQ